MERGSGQNVREVPRVVLDIPSSSVMIKSLQRNLKVWALELNSNIPGGKLTSLPNNNIVTNSNVNFLIN